VADVIDIDSVRPKVWEELKCLFCGTLQRPRKVPKDRKYYDCLSCDETASIPAWQWRYGR
jgi:hypothetical protein